VHPTEKLKTMGSIGDVSSETSLFSFSNTALAAILSRPYDHPYTIEEVAIPHPQPQDALVQLLYTGVCHGDVYARDGGGPAPEHPVRPLVGGHEGVGTIVAMGTDCLDTFRVGDFVGIAWRSFVCGTCQACKNGSENHCFNQKVTGTHRDGTFQRMSSQEIGKRW
jgi:propanol-preferring alcohol dehydrogenase